MSDKYKSRIAMAIPSHAYYWFFLFSTT